MKLFLSLAIDLLSGEDYYLVISYMPIQKLAWYSQSFVPLEAAPRGPISLRVPVT